jgi:hypothetical protein
MTEADERHLRRAIELAAAARAAGDMPYGSLLVGPAGDLLAEDRNTAVTERDITGPPRTQAGPLGRSAARPKPRTAHHDVHKLPALPHVHGCDRALRPRARRLRALRRTVARAQAGRSRQPRRGASRLRGPSAVRRGSRSDRRLLHLNLEMPAQGKPRKSRLTIAAIPLRQGEAEVRAGAAITHAKDELRRDRHTSSDFRTRTQAAGEPVVSDDVRSSHIGRKYSRQAEARKDPRCHERGHLLHLRALEREHLERLRGISALLRIPAVGGVRQLAVRTGR